MAKVRLSEWKKKEVINCCDCKKLGYIEDLIHRGPGGTGGRKMV